MTDNKLQATNAPMLKFKDEAEMLISQAIDRNVPVDTMEKLLAMRRELKQEKAKEEYDRAMAAFQSECPTIVKTKEVKTSSGQVAYRYAPIEDIVAQVKTALRKHGFSYATNMELLTDGVKVSVKVTHAAGHSEVTDMTVPLGNKTQIMSQTQVVAAAQTFAKRYAFCNALGILTGDEDTDAVAIPPSQPEYKLDATVQKRIFALLADAGKTKTDLDLYIVKNFRVDSVTKLAPAQAESLIRVLQKMIQENEIDTDEVERGIEQMKGGGEYGN